MLNGLAFPIALICAVNLRLFMDLDADTFATGHYNHVISTTAEAAAQREHQRSETLLLNVLLKRSPRG